MSLALLPLTLLSYIIKSSNIEIIHNVKKGKVGIEHLYCTLLSFNTAEVTLDETMTNSEVLYFFYMCQE